MQGREGRATGRLSWPSYRRQSSSPSNVRPANEFDEMRKGYCIQWDGAGAHGLVIFSPLGRRVYSFPATLRALHRTSAGRRQHLRLYRTHAESLNFTCSCANENALLKCTHAQDGNYVVTQGMTVGLFAGLLAFNGLLVSAFPSM